MALTESLRKMKQPKWPATSPMIAVHNPIMAIEITKQGYPLAMPDSIPCQLAISLPTFLQRVAHWRFASCLKHNLNTFSICAWLQFTSINIPNHSRGTFHISTCYLLLQVIISTHFGSWLVAIEKTNMELNTHSKVKDEWQTWQNSLIY